ncbi:MAG: HesA/MoeB/ThiF family protein [Chitinophagaceae bacterium]|nr:HesA/MoeB/ThiF family protein [Chitinophagaceae bacterium]
MNSLLESLRYSCQMQLPDFGEAKQQLLKQSKVLMIGAGGLGCPAAQYLAATGVGTITIADFDTVSIGNLHRQILFTPEEVGLNKAIVACKKLQVQNPYILLNPVAEKITASNVLQVIGDHDVVVDGTDNFETRYLINDACVLLGKPLVYGAIYQYEGQVAVWNFQNEGGTRSPNYRDIFPEVNAALIPNCAEGGVIPTLAGIIGCMQANEAIKLITKTGEVLAGKMLMLNAQTLQSRIISIGLTSTVSITQLAETIPVALIAVEELMEHLNDGKFELIDVRSIEERNAFDIGGKHFPIAELDNLIQNISRDKPVVFYCASGKRSTEAVKMFNRNFPEVNAYSLDGGMKAWKEKVYGQ